MEPISREGIRRELAFWKSFLQCFEVARRCIFLGHMPLKKRGTNILELLYQCKVAKKLLYQCEVAKKRFTANKFFLAFMAFTALVLIRTSLKTEKKVFHL